MSEQDNIDINIHDVLELLNMNTATKPYFNRKERNNIALVLEKLVNDKKAIMEGGEISNLEELIKSLRGSISRKPYYDKDERYYMKAMISRLMKNYEDPEINKKIEKIYHYVENILDGEDESGYWKDVQVDFSKYLQLHEIPSDVDSTINESQVLSLLEDFYAWAWDNKKKDREKIKSINVVYRALVYDKLNTNDNKSTKEDDDEEDDNDEDDSDSEKNEKILHLEKRIERLEKQFKKFSLKTD